MAKLNRSFVILRFAFGEGNVKGRQRNDDTYRYVAREIGLSYADKKFVEMKQQLESSVARDVERELIWQASQYRRFITGATGSRDKPAGVLTSVHGDAEKLTLASVLPPWAPRNSKYLDRKFQEVGHKNWFDNRGWDSHGKKWPKLSGLLFKESRADNWEYMFGPIRVRFFKNNLAESPREVVGDHLNIQIGTLRVYALGNITPDMLPGLAAKRVSMASNAGNDGLMGLVKKHSPQMYYRLNRRSSVTRRYRPTLEPFLGFFLTRALPAAVARRIRLASRS